MVENLKTFEAIVIDNTHFSIGFPVESVEKLISRDNYVAQIEDYFSQGVNIIFIEGEEDSGKTTLCAQLAKKKPNESISVFFNSLNILDYQTEFFISNVVYQIKNILNEQVSIGDEKFISIEQYHQYIFQLRKKLKKGNKKIDLIVDGLEAKVAEDPDFVKQLFKIVPFGQEIFQIVLSGSASDFLRNSPILKKEEYRSISLTGFSEPEIKQYLEIYDSEAIGQDVYKVTKGFPGRLKTLKRLVQKEHYSIAQITATTTYKSWIELDCSTVDVENQTIAKVLSVLSLNERAFSVEEISGICGINYEPTEILLGSIGILDVQANHVSFASSAHKRYFSNQLRGNLKKVQELLIKYYSNSETTNSLIELPKIYAQANEWPKIMGVLNEDYTKRILENTGSLKIVNEGLELGIRASEKLFKYSEMWRYSIEASIVNELDSSLYWESEVRARISIKDFAGAISLAESSILKVDRLKMLALIARRQKEFNKVVDEELVKIIQELYTNTDLASVGDKIYDIVADLIYALPNLAIEMIEKASGKASDKNINEWIIAKLSIAAIDSTIKDKENVDGSKKLEAVESLNIPLVRKINKAITFMVGNYTSRKVLEEVGKLSDSKERLRLLRLWLNNNQNNIEDVELVIERALDELVETSSATVITLDVLKELSQQLPFIKDLTWKDKLYQRFRLLENNITDLGLSKNRYTYELNMFHAEFTIDKTKAIYTINRILNEIDSINDNLIKVEAYAETYSKLSWLTHEKIYGKIDFVYSRILSLSKELFDETASHFKVGQYLLQTISKRNPVLCLKICEYINTQSRRENSKLLILDSYLENNLKYVKIDILKIIENSLERRYNKQKLTMRVLERFAEAKSLHYDVIQELFHFTNKVKSFQNQVDKLKCHILSYRMVSKNSAWKERLSKKFKGDIHNSWNGIDANWDRIDLGFTICSDLAKIDEPFAKDIFKETDILKRESWFDSNIVAYTFLNSLKLVLRAFVGLLISENAIADDEKIIEDLMARIPSEVEKLRLWTELGFYVYPLQNNGYFKKILDGHIIPLIHGMVQKKSDLFPVLDSLVLIHLFNSELISDYTQDLAEEIKGLVYSKICFYYVTQRNPFEYYDSKITRYHTSFNDLTKAVFSLFHIFTDADLYYQIDHICKAINFNRSSLSKAQITTLVDELIRIIDRKLPDIKNIRHDGYKLLLNLKVMRVRREAVNYNDYWSHLITNVNAIPNKSDIVFVKALLLEEFPFEKISNGNAVKGDIFSEVINTLYAITSHYEFVQRVIDISEIMYNVNRLKWKEVVSRAFSISSDLKEGSEIYSSRKNLIDSMFRLDPDYARDLIKLMDKSKGDGYLRELLQDHYESLAIADKIKNDKVLQGNEKEEYEMIVKGVTDALKGLNSEKITSKKISEVSSYLPLGNKLPLHQSMPIYMYYLNTCAKTYKAKSLEGSLENLHRDNFKRVVKSTNLIEVLSYRKKAYERVNRQFFVDEDFSTNKAIRPGSREEALGFIKNWLYDEVDEYLYIVDPYFKKEDLEVLRLVKDLNKTIDIEILGSSGGTNINLETDFKDQWKKISDEHPPFANITFCWFVDQPEQSPFHDRWILTKNGGLRLGTSIGSMGLMKESELSIMGPSQALKITENSVIEYLKRKKQTVNNLRLAYKSFTL